MANDFSADWLALREPADHAARSATVAEAVRRHFSDRRSISVVDLGAGAGSNLRYTFRLLPAEQRWLLVDHDPALLDSARAALIRWADDVAPAPAGARDLLLMKEGVRLDIRFAEADLAHDVAGAWPEAVDLVSAAALFDLVSDAFLARLVDTLAARRLPLYAALVYDGRVHLKPPDPLDAKILGAFHTHMTRDKGFGPALGPKAGDGLATRLDAKGYAVTRGESAWQLDVLDTLTVALAQGLADAVGETGLVSNEEIEQWLERRLAAGTWVIGHTDLFARPPA